jgi:hypothetical protein
MKIFVDNMKNDLLDYLPEEFLSNVVNEVQCMNSNCTGKVHYLLKQTIDGAVSVCPKCKMAVKFRITEI